VKNPNSLIFLIFLASLAAISPLCIDMALPALPRIAASLHCLQGEAGLTLSVFMAGFAFMPVIYGPLSDRFGRRPILLVGIFLLLIGSAASALAPNISALLAARFVEGAGAGAGTSMAFAIVRDCFSGEDGRRKLSYVQLVMNLAPMLAPSIGAVVLFAGWRAIYGTLAAGAVLLLLTVMFGLKETHNVPQSRETLAAQISRSYLTLLRSRAGLGFSLVYAFSFGVQFTYVAGSPLVFMTHFGLSPRQYGAVFFSTACGIMAGAFTNTRLARHNISGGFALQTGMGIYLAVPGALLVLLATHHAAMLPTAALLVVSAYGFGLIGPNASHGALQALSGIAGIAGAVLTSLQMGTAFIASAIVAAAYARFGMLAMVVPMLGFGLLTLGAYFGLARGFAPGPHQGAPPLGTPLGPRGPRPQ
jgi:DHA1 family bicyclomycin/chloramphenicol resistance-like MFS transporter